MGRLEGAEGDLKNSMDMERHNFFGSIVVVVELHVELNYRVARIGDLEGEAATLQKRTRRTQRESEVQLRSGCSIVRRDDCFTCGCAQESHGHRDFH